MMKIKKDYEFQGYKGGLKLLDLFEGRSQLIVCHFIFDPEWDEGCRSCSLWADYISRGHINHHHTRDTTLALISRAPFAKLKIFEDQMGWTVPWYSSYGSDFNYEYQATTDDTIAAVMDNYRDKLTLQHPGMDYHTQGEQPVISCFLNLDNEIFHTYSAYGRGTEMVGGATYFLDLTALGRQEKWEDTNSCVTGRLKYFENYNTF